MITETGREITATQVIDRATGLVLVERNNVSYRVVGPRELFTFEMVKEDLEGFQDAERALPWWIADLFLWGLANYGDDIYQAVREEYDLSHKTVKNWVWIAGAIPWQVRRKELSIWDHGEVAPMAAGNLTAVTRLLDLAVTQKWSRAHLRAYVLRVQRELDEKSLPKPDATGRQLVLTGPETTNGSSETTGQSASAGVITPLNHCRTCVCYDWRPE